MARKAEKIAQNHSTMKSFEESFALKQKSRKRPQVRFDSFTESPASESETQDFKNIRKLAKIDAGLALEKEYTYKNGPGKNVDEESDDENDDDLSVSNDVSKENVDKYDDQPNKNDSDDNSSEGDNENCLSENDDDNFESENDDNVSSADRDIRIARLNHINDTIVPFESTNRELQELNMGSSIPDYKEFSDERRLPVIEKAVMWACKQLEENKAILTEIKENSSKSNLMVQSLMGIVKDLTVEVFDNKAEISKRNGMFTDILMPDFPLHIMTVQQYDTAESELEKHKVVDNLVSPY